MAEEIGTRSGRSLRGLLDEHGLRLVQWPEFCALGMSAVLECLVCGEAHFVLYAGTIPSRCPQCGTSLAQFAPKFWLVTDKSRPIPDE